VDLPITCTSFWSSPTIIILTTRHMKLRVSESVPSI
jgi:hypothetical protein